MMAVLCLIGLFAACSAPRPDEGTYFERLIAERAAKDESFSGPDSIVPLDRRSWMVPLHYYDPDPAYRVPAQLRVGDDQPIFEIPTSTGPSFGRCRELGRSSFMLTGEALTLAALRGAPGAGFELPLRSVPGRDER